MAVTSTNKMKIPVTDVELAFRAKKYADVKDVQKKEIVCASCNTDLNAAVQKSQNIFVHPILETLQCKKCSTYYGDGEFSLDEDGTDKYCRFCGNGGNLYICGNSDCPYGFCKNCATKKVGQPLNKLEAEDWQCLCCEPKPLWKLRAICAAVITHCSKNQRKHGKNRSSGSVRFQLAEDDNPVESTDNDFERSESIRNFRTKLDRKIKQKKLNEKFEKLKKIAALCDDDKMTPSPEITKPFYDEKSSSSADEAAQLRITVKSPAQKSDDKQQEDDKTKQEKDKTNSDSKNNKQNVSSKGSKAKNQKMSTVEDSESDDQHKVQSKSKNEKTIRGIRSKMARDTSPKSHSGTDSSLPKRPHRKASKTNPNRTTRVKTRSSLQNSNCSSNSNSEDESDSAENDQLKNVAKRKRKRKSISRESRSSSKKIKKSRDSDSDKESDSRKSKISEKDTESKAKTISIVSETVVDKKHRFSLSTEKPPLTKTRRLFSLDNNSKQLEEKQAESSKITDSKLSKSKEYVTKQQAKVIRKHVMQVVNQMKTLGSALSFSADKLNEKYLRNNMSRIDVATKAIHKSRLLMNRSMKRLREVDQEFTSSCKFWGKDNKVPSIAAVLESFTCDNDEITDLDLTLPITDKDENLTGDSYPLEPSSSPSLENPVSPSTLAETSSISKHVASAKRSTKKSNDEEEDPASRNSDEKMEVCPNDSQTKTVSEDTEQSETATSGLSSKKKRLSTEEMNNNSDAESETLHDSRNASDSTHIINNEKDSSSENSSKNMTTDQSFVKATDGPDDMLSENNDDVATNGITSEPIVSKESAEKMHSRRKSSSDHDAADTQESTDSFDLVDKSEIDSVEEPVQDKQEIELSKSVKNHRIECKKSDNKNTASNNNKINNGLDVTEDLEKNDCGNHESPPQSNEHNNDDRTTHCSPESSDSNNSSKRNSKTRTSKSSKDIASNVASDEEPPAENDRSQSSDQELFENSKEMEDECIKNSEEDTILLDKTLSTQDDDEIIASDTETILDPEKKKKSISAENDKTGEKDSPEQDLIDREGDDAENVIMSSSNSEADNLEKCDVQWKDSETDSDEKLLRDIRSDIESANARHLEAVEDEAMKDANITADSIDSEEDLKRKMLEHGSDLSDVSEEPVAPNEVELNNSEDERKKQMLASDTELSDVIDALSPAASPANSDTKILSDGDDVLSDDSQNKSPNSEEELKRKILESDSDEPENGESKSESLSDPTLKTLGKILESDADTSDIVASSQKSNSSRKENKESTSITKSPDGNKTTVARKNVKRNSSISSKSTDAEDTALNAIAKKQLLSSSDDSDISDLGTPRIKVCSFANEFANDGVDSTGTVKSGNSETSKTKKKKFNIKKNSHYAKDEKLQMICQVVVRRLDKKVLENFANVLDKSKQRQAHKSFQSLVNLKNLKKHKKKDASSASDSDNSSSTPRVQKIPKKKKTNVEDEKEDTLMDHLEKVQNGENTENSTDDQLDETTNKSKDATSATSHDVFVKKANEVAKSLLMVSSDSDIDNQSGRDNDEEKDEESNKKSNDSKKKDETKKDSKKKKTNSDDANVSDDEVNEDEDKSTNQKDSSDSEATHRRKKMLKKLDKRHWKISDSDTSDDERRLKKSEKRRKSSEQSDPDADAEKPLEVVRKRTSKGKRRVLNSDSDSPKLSDEEENEKETGTKESDSENSELIDRRKKRKRKQKEKDSNDSDSSPDEKVKKTKRKRIKKVASDSDSENQDSSQESPGKSHRKNIRKVLKDKQVADQTKMAGKEEEERLKRIAERQKLYNEMYEMKLAGEEKVDKLVLDFDEETKKELITVHPELVKRLKPHQAQGIKFMWDACFESLEQIKKTKGSGCILAHCMGLGKTFQVVTLSHTLLSHSETGVKTVMVVCPLSTVLNWVNEFKLWLRNVNDGDDIEIFEMTKLKKNFERKFALQSWQKAGGVMIIGYEMFRILSNSTGKKMRKNMQEAILKCLVDPGPDLIICDEGHLLKNEDTALSKAMKRVKTLRRVVLTGTPLQNNLTEYHCMVQFVKPNLLGTKKEFLNRFVNPITNGQFDDSTEYDVKLMKKRAHVLHKMLEGSVQRFDYSVLTPFLPPKQEYVISVRLSEIQIELYQYYIDNLTRHKVGVGGSLFADFQALQRIWTHPVVLRMNAEKMEKKKRTEDSDTEGSLKDFLDDGSVDSSSSDADSDVRSVHDSNEEPTSKSQRRTRANPIDEEEEEPVKEEETESTEWWRQFVKPEHFEDMRVSSKLILLFAILKESEQLGDKVLVFSQSLYALTLIEDFLEKIDESTQKGGENELLENHTGSWYLGLDYFRLDGQTAPENRNQFCKIFNNPKNTRARLFLISTRAGGLGINLTAANRVIIFDASWNPSHDVQSIFRIYRFGQKKPCYVYRFLSYGTMEEKIYNRQVTKLSLSCRVVDEQQIERHYSNHDLAELYQFEPNTSGEKPTLALPKDRLLAEIFLKYKDLIETYHEHDSLLENKAEEELDEEERKEAWKEYEEERKGLRMNMNYMPNQNMLLQQYAMANPNFAHNQADIANRAALSGFSFDTLQALIQKDYPNATPEQQKMMTTRAVLDMYNYMENQAVRQHQPMIPTPANNFNYPTVNNINPTSFTDNNAALQYSIQQQQQQALVQMQRQQQMNYAQRFSNAPSTILTPIQEIQIDDHDVIEMESEPRLATPSVGTATASSTTTVPAVVPVLSSKRQEE